MPQYERARELCFGGAAGSADDAELSRLGAEFQEKHRRHVELAASQRGVAGDQSAEDRAEVQSLIRAKAELGEAIGEQRAATIVGLKVKAAVLLAYSDDDLDGQLHWTDHNELTRWSIARDLLGDDVAQPPEGSERAPPQE
jgi:hypothetical protein